MPNNMCCPLVLSRHPCATCSSTLPSIGTWSPWFCLCQNATRLAGWPFQPAFAHAVTWSLVHGCLSSILRWLCPDYSALSYWTLPSVVTPFCCLPQSENEPGACFYSGSGKEAAALLCLAGPLSVRHCPVISKLGAGTLGMYLG